MAIGDITTTCKKCKEPFTISAKHAEWFESKGLLPPKRCAACRAAMKAKQAAKETGNGDT